MLVSSLGCCVGGGHPTHLRGTVYAVKVKRLARARFESRPFARFRHVEASPQQTPNNLQAHQRRLKTSHVDRRIAANPHATPDLQLWVRRATGPSHLINAYHSSNIGSLHHVEGCMPRWLTKGSARIRLQSGRAQRQLPCTTSQNSAPPKRHTNENTGLALLLVAIARRSAAPIDHAHRRFYVTWAMISSFELRTVATVGFWSYVLSCPTAQRGKSRRFSIPPVSSFSHAVEADYCCQSATAGFTSHDTNIMLHHPSLLSDGGRSAASRWSAMIGNTEAEPTMELSRTSRAFQVHAPLTSHESTTHEQRAASGKTRLWPL
nr:hypothetical protein CFP56_67822 [Quercus suber]